MQASLFADYFIQCVGVHNISNDILSGESSIEVRSLFLNKNIIKFAINLPIEYKINAKTKISLFKTKPILKKVFTDTFGDKLLFKKQGFSGFPNESQELLNIKEKLKFKRLCNSFKKENKLTRAMEWKILNLFYYNKFSKSNLNIKDLFN